MSVAEAPLRAAGIMFVSPTNQVLLLRRSPFTRDYPGTWCIPGGGIEDGENAEAAACREAVEEIGSLPKGERHEWTRRIADGVDFTTFVQRVAAPFQPMLNSEHDAWQWCTLPDPAEASALLAEAAAA